MSALVEEVVVVVELGVVIVLAVVVVLFLIVVPMTWPFVLAGLGVAVVCCIVIYKMKFIICSILKNI